MRKTSLILLCCLSCLMCIGQSKVYWIHGYQSGSYFWSNFRSVITPYSNRGAVIDWNPNRSFIEIADSIDNGTISVDKQRAILIGHSAGGLVARQIQKNDSKVKSVITVGTPNNGAGIANSVYTRNYYNVFNKTMTEANNAVRQTLNAASNCAPPVSWIISPLSVAVSVFLPIAEFLTLSKVAVYLENYINESYRNDETLKDMRPSSSFVSSLNASSPSVPMLSIYGAEDTWPLLRLLATFEGEASETEYFSYVYQADDVINQICSVHEEVYDALKWPAIIMPWIWITRERVYDSESNWKDVGRYIDYDIHNIYSEMLGSYHTETRTYTTGWWIFKKTHTQTVKVYEDHDGMITERDAKLDKSNVKNIKLQGVNHMEMGNNPLVEETLIRTMTYGDNGTEFQYSRY